MCNAFWTQKVGAGPNVGRMVVDSRPLNVLIRRGHHPAYDPATLVKGMDPELRSYWKCDLSQAFYQCRITEESSKKYLNFLCEFGYFRFCRSVMGMSPSSSTLGQALDAKTGHLIATRKLVRQADDYLGAGKDDEEACNMLEAFLDVCAKEGITLSPKKFEWGGFNQPIQWAGLTVQAGGARPDEKRIEAVSRFPVPTNKASLRSWIALVNQLGYHVPGLSAKTRLQRELLKKEAVFLWTEEHNKEFLAIREEVGDPNTLWHYDSEMDLGVSIDTQRTNGPNSEAVAGLGFVCFNYYRDQTKAEQTGLGGPLHPKHSGIRALQFGSIAAKDSWKSKPPVVIEGLGAIAALHKLHYFCRGQAVIDMFLDSKTMVEAWCNKGLEEMAPGLQDIMIELARWPLRLHYCEGKKHIIPDSLGRNCVSGQEEYGPELDEVEGKAQYPRLVGQPFDSIKLSKLVHDIQEGMEDEEIGDEEEEEVRDRQDEALAMSLEEAYKAAEEDQAYKIACEWVAEGKSKAEVVNAGHTNPVHQFKQWWDSLSVMEEQGKEGGSRRRLLIYNCDKLVVPKPLVTALIDMAHKPHKGEQITLAFLKRYFVWSGMNNQVRQKCRDCIPCNTYTKSRPKEPEVKMRKRPPRPWFMCGMDFFDYKGDHVMAVVDYLTSYIIIHTFKSTPSSKQTTDALDTICRQNGGYFSILATDGGPQMASAHFKQWLDDKYIIHRQSSATAAWSNGRSERAVQDLRTMWDRAEFEKGSKLTLPERAHLLSLFNDSPRAVGAASPARLHFRRQYRHPGMPAFEVEIFDKGEEILGWQKKEDRKEAANKRVATNQRKPLNLTVGLKVLVEDKQGNNTLPGEVVGVRSQRSCWVQMTDTDRIFLRNRKFLVEDPAFRTDHIINMLKSAVASGDARRGEGGFGDSCLEGSTSSQLRPALRRSGAKPRVGRAVTFADTVEVSGSQSQPGAAAVAHESSGAEGVAQHPPRTFADIVKGNTWHPAAAAAPQLASGGGGKFEQAPATAAAPQLASGGNGKFEQAPKVTFSGSSPGEPACQLGAGATGSLQLLPGGGAGAGQLAADLGGQGEAEVDALRAVVADLRDKLAQVEAFLGRL